MINVSILNSLVKALQFVGNQTFSNDVKLAGKPELVNSPISNEDVCILIGITGEIKGQVAISFPSETALSISESMLCNFFSGELDEMARSSLSELGNMVMGNFCTLVSQSGIIMDITPPTLISGSGISLSVNSKG